MRLTETFRRLAAARKKALVTYTCAGDPSLEESVELALACAEAGADVLELGVPFSDPTADGPVIARAGQRALAAGGGLASALRAAALVRARSSVPIVLFGYYNPIFVMGERAFCAAAHDAGVDAVLVVDLPVEESGPLRAEARAAELSVVPLLTPTSGEARRRATREAIEACPAGFAYYVSVTGVTGHGDAPLAAASLSAGALRGELGCPVVVGFGVDSGERARVAAQHADGVVVGTALVRRIEEAPDGHARRAAVQSFVRSLREAVDADAPAVHTADHR